MIEERRIRLSREDGQQTIHIPSDFEFPCDEVVLRKDGQRLVVEPGTNPSLHELLEAWANDPIEEEIGPIEDALPEPFKL